jgi:primosomal protein N' (replication factor Y)
VTVDVDRRRVVRVLPDVPAIAKTFDYLVPEALGDQVRVGTRVRIALGPRRVGGWVVATDVDAPPGVTLRPLAKLSGYGPPPELIELAHWAAWRWAGRPASFLRTASPERVVDRLPAAAPPGELRSWSAGHDPAGAGRARRGGRDAAVGEASAAGDGSRSRPDRSDPAAREAFAAGRAVLRLPPAAAVDPVCLHAAALGNALVLCPSLDVARSVGQRLRRAGVTVAFHPADWAQGAAGATVVGTRAAAWAPVGGLAAVVVLDEHDEAHAQEQAPTWHARDVAIERARRAGVPCVAVSPCPSLEALAWGRLVAPSRVDERAGWPVVDVVDRRRDDPRTGLFSPSLVNVLRDTSRRVVCVLNRTGRARLLACAACGELARCEACDAAVTQPDEGRLVCPRCGRARPAVCLACGGMRLKVLRQGVSRARDELAALVGEPVDEISASVSKKKREPEAGVRRSGSGTRVIVGTEAVLHQVDRVDVVAFLDLDQELLAPRYRAIEQALGLVVRAARLVGGKAGGGRLVVQTRLPRHEVVQAVLRADPTLVTRAEAERRELLRFPPAAALAEVSGPVAEAFVAGLRGAPGIEVLGPADGRWLVRSIDHSTLCEALAATPRPPGRLRVAVDPLRV